MKGLFRRGKSTTNNNNKSSASTSSLSTSGQIEISAPFNVRLEHHVDFDREFGLSGVPKDWDLSSLQGIHFTVDDVHSVSTPDLNGDLTSHHEGVVVNDQSLTLQNNNNTITTRSGSFIHNNTNNNNNGGDSSPSLSVESVHSQQQLPPPALNTSNMMMMVNNNNNNNTINSTTSSPSLSSGGGGAPLTPLGATNVVLHDHLIINNNNKHASLASSTSSFFSKWRSGNHSSTSSSSGGGGGGGGGSFIGKNNNNYSSKLTILHSSSFDVNTTANSSESSSAIPTSSAPPTLMIVSSSSLPSVATTGSSSQPHEPHSKSASQGFFAKIFTKTSSKSVTTPIDSSSSSTVADHVTSNGQFVMNFTNVRRTEAGYYVEVGSNDVNNSMTLNMTPKFKKDKLLIDLISHENPFRLFTKMKKIGTGSTADVYKAIHVPSGKKVAIKVMSLTTSKNTNFDMIENEIFMMKHACKAYSSIFDYDAALDKTLMVQYFGTYSTVNCQVHEHIGRYLSDSKRRKLQQPQSTSQQQQQPQSNSTILSPNSSNSISTTIDMDTMLEYKEKSHDELWVTMEYVSGGKLTDLIGDNNVIHHRFLESEIAAILIPILKCLHLLHTKYGVIHR